MAAAVLVAGGSAFTPAGLGGGGSPCATAAVKVAYLLCFATSWGATVWAVFISGVIMFLNLPRHMMGSLRGKVFPACFALTAASTAVSASAFAWLHHLPSSSSPADRRQLVVLAATAGLDLANLLVFSPKTLEVVRERHKVERGLGIGDVGSLDGMRSNARAAVTCTALAAANGPTRSRCSPPSRPPPGSPCTRAISPASLRYECQDSTLIQTHPSLNTRCLEQAAISSKNELVYLF
ncbi:hypothetical protein HU200_003291 [Digitaria exilis]|uniref:TMEM205-like domain-containing protein n=1 Tax=Digitaria exilis TaxID=1010633 RepID=A0A835KT74_9POAL|nr:hypothetical protein HU200_003291 [Digitaria exilis]